MKDREHKRRGASRRELLKTAGAALGAVAGVPGAARAVEFDLESFFQKHCRELSQEDLDSLLQRLERKYSEKYGKPILKVAPLANWSEEEVKAYIHQHDVPINELHAKGYPSIGCMICTSPILAWESDRAGRWRWEKREERKECGLHLGDGSGI